MYKDITDVPEDILITLRVRMYALGALVWDYVDTVMSISVQMRRSETKKLNRTVRMLRDEYDSFRRLNTDTDYLAQEQVWAQDFETIISGYMQQLLSDTRAQLGEAVESETRMLLIGVQQAMCICEALQIYTKGCDNALSRYGVYMRNKTLLPRQFRLLSMLLPEYSGNMRVTDITVRRNIAGNIAKELAKVAVCDMKGDLEQPDLQL